MLSTCLIICQIFLVVLEGSCQCEHCNFFDFKLLEAACAQDEFSNVVVAPLSVKAALMSLLEVTDGQARRELLSILKLPSDVKQIRKRAREVLKPFQSVASDMESEMATRLWCANNSEPFDNYTDDLQNYYNIDYATVDFTNSTSLSENINQWAREKTRNNTQSIVESAHLSKDALIVMTSALHFKGNWYYGFYEDSRWHGCYMIPDRGCHGILTMHNRFEHNYAFINSLDAEVLELPYVDDRLSMLLFHPRNEGFPSLNNLIKNLARTPISTILANLQKTEIDLVLPIFQIEAKNDIVPVLKSMGIRNLFDKKANLSGILQDSFAHIDSVFYSIKVETHTVGKIESNEFDMLIHVAATDKWVHIDRPFVFAIIDRPSHGILFAGRVVHPESDVPDPQDYANLMRQLHPILGDF